VAHQMRSHAQRPTRRPLYIPKRTISVRRLRAISGRTVKFECCTAHRRVIPQADIESIVVGYGHAAEDNVRT
jgi:hypothetical protein